MRVIALYLPQYHRIPENDEWWGEGYTEWVNVKRAKPLFENHQQPRVPLDNNYYDLTDIDVMKWQVEIARNHGIYGFCFYHYWFSGKKLLEKPVDNFLDNKDIDFPFCICWANEHWSNKWSAGNDKVLIEQKYGDKSEWKEHFDYILPFLKDSRYIYQDGKPIFVIYRPELIEKRKEMMNYWNELAIQNGLNGICFIFQHPGVLYNYPDEDLSMFDYCVEYQPATYWVKNNANSKLRTNLLKIRLLMEKHFKIRTFRRAKEGVIKDSYDDVWLSTLEGIDKFPNCIPCAPVDWDNTPRWGNKGRVFVGRSCEKFKLYFSKLIKKVKEAYPTDMIFVFAWNEWGEGGYLEPDTLNGYGNLESIRDALIENGELNNY